MNTEQEKRKALERKAKEALQRIAENTDTINENRQRADRFGDSILEFHDSIQHISSDIASMEAEMLQCGDRERNLIHLNEELANAENEYSEVNCAFQRQ